MCWGYSSKWRTKCLIDTPLIDLCEWVFLSSGYFPRHTAVAFKFTRRLKVERQRRGRKVYRGHIDYGLRGLEGGVDKQVDHM